MSGTKRAAPVLQHQDGQAENGSVRKTAHDSTQNDTTFHGGGQIQIADLLMHGADHALPLRQLKQMTGLPGRDLRRRIEAARIAGEPILSDGNGYFLAENQHEVTQFVTSMNRRAKRIQAVAAAVERIAVE